jgi:hypothetical protein
MNARRMTIPPGLTASDFAPRNRALRGPKHDPEKLALGLDPGLVIRFLDKIMLQQIQARAVFRDPRFAPAHRLPDLSVPAAD